MEAGMGVMQLQTKESQRWRPGTRSCGRGKEGCYLESQKTHDALTSWFQILGFRNMRVGISTVWNHTFHGTLLQQLHIHQVWSGVQTPVSFKALQVILVFIQDWALLVSYFFNFSIWKVVNKQICWGLTLEDHDKYMKITRKKWPSLHPKSMHKMIFHYIFHWINDNPRRSFMTDLQDQITL